MPQVRHYLIPKIILWDPLAQVTDLNGQLKCRRAECKSGSSYLRPVHWKDGRTQRECWRFLYGVDGPVFLISRVYRCIRQHEIIAHDVSLTESLPQTTVPFVLSLITGVTYELINAVVSCGSAGLSMEQIEQMIKQRYMNACTDRGRLYERENQLFLQSHANSINSQEALQLPLEPVADYEGPSDNIISDCFLFDFKWKEHLYNTHMSQLSATSFSCDHTFKIAANIGLKRKSDGKWERQYDSAFFVMNENGEVISWQLTKGTAFATVETLFVNLKKRFEKQGVSFLFFTYSVSGGGGGSLCMHPVQYNHNTV